MSQYADRRILLFDLSVGGHHPAYIQHLIRYWGEQKLPGRLDIVVMPKFLEQHQDVVEIAQTYGSDRINFVPITEEEVTWLGPWTTFARKKLRALREWTILNRYAKALGSTECLIMYFDTFQFSTVLRRPLPCPFSGLYFRARFHYDEFPESVLSWKDKVRHWQERFHISQVVGHPQLKTLFSLDQFAVKYLNQFHNPAKAVYLPDPVQIYSNSESNLDELKTSLGIEAHRQIFLLFGVLDSRKGIHQLLEAISLLPANLCQKLCLLLVGPIKAQEKPEIKQKIEQLSQILPIQIVVYDKFVIDRENQPYFQLADVVLAPYQRHVGTSSILIRAAAAQKPVLCSNYGLMGEWTRHYQLGINVDSTVPAEIAQGLTKFLLESPAKFGDRTLAKSFAVQNSAENYARTIFNDLYQKN
ncbi:glycosyltransferase family 4 protein [Nostoc linckia FACHB-104]|nr:glycosyltransferase family 4 protein [Nostoc linckia FACHB-104]